MLAALERERQCQLSSALLRAIVLVTVFHGPMRHSPSRACRGRNVDNPAARTLMRRHPSFATLGAIELLPRGCSGG